MTNKILSIDPELLRMALETELTAVKQSAIACGTFGNSLDDLDLADTLIRTALEKMRDEMNNELWQTTTTDESARLYDTLKNELTSKLTGKNISASKKQEKTPSIQTGIRAKLAKWLRM